MYYFALAPTLESRDAIAAVVGFGLDAMRFSARRTAKGVLPEGLGEDHGVEFDAVARQLADDLRSGDRDGACSGFSRFSNGAFDEPGSQAAALLFSQSARDFLCLADGDSEGTLDAVAPALAQTLDAATLTLAVARSDEAWRDTAQNMARSGEIDRIHQAYLAFGGLDAEFLAHVAALCASGQDDVEGIGRRISVNYQREALDVRRRQDLLASLDLVHHVSTVANYASLLRAEPHGVDEEHRQRASEVALSCGARLLDDIYRSRRNYGLFVDQRHAAVLAGSGRLAVDEATTWRDVLPDTRLLQGVGAAIDARSDQPLVCGPTRD